MNAEELVKLADKISLCNTGRVTGRWMSADRWRLKAVNSFWIKNDLVGSGKALSLWTYEMAARYIEKTSFLKKRYEMKSRIQFGSSDKDGFVES